MLLYDAMADYLRYAKTEKGLTPKTMEPYQCWLRHYVLWLKDHGYPEPTLQDFNTTNLRQFYYYCREERNHRPRTVRGAFAPLLSFGDYLVLQKVVERNPAQGVVLPKKDAAERIVVSDVQVMALWDACDRIYPPRRSALARGVLACFAYAGLRSFEALALKLRDTDVESGGKRLTIRHGKGNKSRGMFLPPPAVEAIRAWLAIRGTQNHDWLWSTGPNRHLGERGLGDLMIEVRTVAGYRDEAYITPILSGTTSRLASSVRGRTSETCRPPSATPN